MIRAVLVVGADKDLNRTLCALLETAGVRTGAQTSLGDAEAALKRGECQAIILDLDTAGVDNRLIRDFKRENPRIQILGLSGEPFHPELREAVSHHIAACLGKPVDRDELFYWLKAIDDNGPSEISP